MERVLTILLAGAAGERLAPLTLEQAKPMMPFGGIYRLIGVTQSNYDDLSKKAPKLEFSAAQVERMREYLDQARKPCTGRFENHARKLDRQLREAQSRLRQLRRDIAPEANCPPVERKEYKPGQRIETICSLPGA